MVNLLIRPVQILIVLISFLASSCQHAGAQAGSDATPVWQATDAQRALLGAPASVNGYTVSPPRGFIPAPEIAKAFQSHIPSGQTMFASAWRGAVQPDGQFPMLVLVTTAIPSGVSGDVPPDAVLHGFLTSFQRARTHFVQSKIELGQINGLPAARAYWKSTRPESPGQTAHRVRGLAYTYFDAKTRAAVILYAEDTERYYAAIPSAALEAAALTLKPD